MTKVIAHTGDIVHRTPTATLEITSPTPFTAAGIPKPRPRTSAGNSVAAVLLSVVSQTPMYKPENPKIIANRRNDSPCSKSSDAGMTARE